MKEQFKDYNKEIILLFYQSKLTKIDFSNAIGIKKQNLNNILNYKNQLRRGSYNKYLQRLIESDKIKGINFNLYDCEVEIVKK
jgi:CRISPR/Cas system CMR-associated protein Cmr5 small subunit